MKRPDGRKADELRSVRITPDFIGSADGSALIEIGRTRVVCTATFETKVPPWMKGKGTGWITAEYGMLPAATSERSSRPGPGKVNSRASEISRLIGRSLRAGADLAALGENQVIVDCDVLEADGGTRVASITGGWVALARAVRRARKDGRLPEGPEPITEQIIAISCGIVGGRPRLDLEYTEDSVAEVDMNVAATAGGRLVEVQVSGEEATFSPHDLQRLLAMALKGCRRLAQIQDLAARSPLRAKTHGGGEP
jgi:ribonuclease PH